MSDMACIYFFCRTVKKKSGNTITILVSYVIFNIRINPLPSWASCPPLEGAGGIVPLWRGCRGRIYPAPYLDTGVSSILNRFLMFPEWISSQIVIPAKAGIREY
jgi:hypothetical protein